MAFCLNNEEAEHQICKRSNTTFFMCEHLYCSTFFVTFTQKYSNKIWGIMLASLTKLELISTANSGGHVHTDLRYVRGEGTK